MQYSATEAKGPGCVGHEDVNLLTRRVGDTSMGTIGDGRSKLHARRCPSSHEQGVWPIADGSAIPGAYSLQLAFLPATSLYHVHAGTSSHVESTGMSVSTNGGTRLARHLLELLVLCSMEEESQREGEAGLHDTSARDNHVILRRL